MSFELEARLEQCDPNRENCFARDPEALNALAYSDDGAIRRTFDNIATAADTAGAEGTDLKSATYTTTTLEIIGSIGPEAVSARLIDDETISIYDLLKDPTIDPMGARIARCAFACARAGSGNCPLKAIPYTDSAL